MLSKDIRGDWSRNVSGRLLCIYDLLEEKHMEKEIEELEDLEEDTYKDGRYLKLFSLYEQPENFKDFYEKMIKNNNKKTIKNYNKKIKKYLNCCNYPDQTDQINFVDK